MNKVRAALPWLAAGLFAILLTVLAYCPAAWLASALERQSGGRLTLGDATGTLWRGSAFIGGAPSGKDAVTPLLPGRFSWRLSPLLLLGQVELELSNPVAMPQPVMVRGGWTHWDVAPGLLDLPISGLAGLGAPLNTLAPTGQMQLSWSALSVGMHGSVLYLDGRMSLRLDDVASQLSSIRPLGAYQMVFDWHGAQARIALTTVNGPLLLSGTGMLDNGRFRFSGKASAETGQEERLANMLNLLGQRRKEGDKNFIALEF